MSGKKLIAVVGGVFGVGLVALLVKDFIEGKKYGLDKVDEDEFDEDDFSFNADDDIFKDSESSLDDEDDEESLNDDCSLSDDED